MLLVHWAGLVLCKHRASLMLLEHRAGLGLLVGRFRTLQKKSYKKIVGVTLTYPIRAAIRALGGQMPRLVAVKAFLKNDEFNPSFFFFF
jgi:hypothetical protein